MKASLFLRIPTSIGADTSLPATAAALAAAAASVFAAIEPAAALSLTLSSARLVPFRQSNPKSENKSENKTSPRLAAVAHLRYSLQIASAPPDGRVRVVLSLPPVFDSKRTRALQLAVHLFVARPARELVKDLGEHGKHTNMYCSVCRNKALTLAHAQTILYTSN